MERRIIAQILLGVILLFSVFLTFITEISIGPNSIPYGFDISPREQARLQAGNTVWESIPIILFIAGTALIISGIMKYRDISQK